MPFRRARDYSRAYLHHLVKSNEMLGAVLLSAINLAYYQQLTAGMRAAIAERRFAEFRAETDRDMGAGRSAAALNRVEKALDAAAPATHNRIHPNKNVTNAALEETRPWPST